MRMRMISEEIIFFKRQIFQAFTSRIWIMLSTIIIISSILLTVMKTKGRFSINLIFENYIRVWGIYCQQSLSGNAR